LFRDSTASHSSNTSNYLRNSWLQYFMRQQSCERRLKELGYDAQGRLLATPVPLLHVPVKECQWILSGGFMKDPVVFNPVVTFLSVSTLWTIVIWCAGTFVKRREARVRIKNDLSCCRSISYKLDFVSFNLFRA
jgi:hypothetical protein